MLVASDVSLAVVLLAGAGLMIKSVGRLLGVDPGFNPDRVLTMQVSFVGQAYEKDEQVVAKTDEMLAKLRELSAVTTAATASQVPLGGNGDCWGVHIQGLPAPTPADDPCPERYGVTPDYFTAMQIPLRSGRLFTSADRASSEAVLIIGERTARTLWPKGDAIGQHVRIGDHATGPGRTIIGVVGDVRHVELASPPTLQMYTPQTQVTESYLTVVLETKGDPSALAGDARRAIWSAASDVPVYEVATLSDLVARSVGPRRFLMILLELFGLVALAMTAVGLYGVISYSVAERMREIGLRAALGASRLDIVRLVAGGGLGVVSAGLAIGVVISVGATRYLEGSLYGVQPTDPATFGRVVGVLFGVGSRAGHPHRPRDAGRSCCRTPSGIVSCPCRRDRLTKASSCRLRGQHVANRRNLPGTAHANHDERRPHLARGRLLGAGNLVGSIGNRHVGARETDVLNGDRACAARLHRRGQRTPNDRLASLPPLAGRHELVGILGEERSERLDIAMLPCVEVFLHDLADRRRVATRWRCLRRRALRWRDKADDEERQ